MIALSSLEGSCSLPPLPYLLSAGTSSCLAAVSFLLSLKSWILSVSTCVKHSFANTWQWSQSAAPCGRSGLFTLATGRALAACAELLGCYETVPRCCSSLLCPLTSLALLRAAKHAALIALLPPSTLSPCSGTVLFWFILFHKCQTQLNQCLKIFKDIFKIFKDKKDWNQVKKEKNAVWLKLSLIMLCTWSSQSISWLPDVSPGLWCPQQQS